MSIDHFSEVHQVRLTVGSIIGMVFSVNPFKDHNVKLEYDTNAFDKKKCTQIHADEDSELQFYDFIAKKEGQFIIKAGIQFGNSGQYFDTRKYEIEVVTDSSSCV